jgi:hypothetical protein
MFGAAMVAVSAPSVNVAPGSADGSAVTRVASAVDARVVVNKAIGVRVRDGLAVKAAVGVRVTVFDTIVCVLESCGVIVNSARVADGAGVRASLPPDVELGWRIASRYGASPRTNAFHSWRSADISLGGTELAACAKFNSASPTI